MSKFMDLPFSFIMDLYRTRIKLERNNDLCGLANLKRHYAELFSNEFEEFIENAKLSVAYLDSKYNQNFWQIFEPDKQDDVGTLH